MSALALLLSVGAFALFGLSTHHHHRRWFGGIVTSAGEGILRRAAWLALALALATCVAARGWVMGPVLWTGMMMLGAGLVFLFLNLAPARFERSSRHEQAVARRHPAGPRHGRLGA